MNQYKWLSTFLVLALVVLIGLSIGVPHFRESDSDVLMRISANQAKAPKIEYPTKDIRNRKVPTFNYVVVFPECKSCSDFRKRAREFMESHTEYVFLILTPDMKGNADLLKHDRYFVVEYPSNSRFSKIPPGAYAK